MATYTAPDPEGARAIVWSLVPETLPSGSFPFDGNGDGDATDDVDIMEADAADDGHFKISMDGVLSFKSSPNYEVADGQGAADDDNEYKVVVRASDGGETYAYHKVTVMVTNEEEPGTVMLSALQPQVGIALTATHSDPDGGVTPKRWPHLEVGTISRNGRPLDHHPGGLWHRRNERLHPNWRRRR